FSVFKPTGLARFEVFRKVTEKEPLNDEEKKHWHQTVEYYDVISKAAKDAGVSLLIDAEHSWMQGAADDLCEKMMKKYNTEIPVFFNTLQLYRCDRLDYLKDQHRKAKEGGYKLGYKIVRGAYLEGVYERAKEKNSPTVICDSKKATDDIFNETMQYILENFYDIALYIGSDNEATTYLVMDHME